MAKYLIGTAQLDSYDPEKEKWENYQERVELWFTANDVKPANHASTLLSLIGADVYGILKDLVAPDRPVEKSYTELVRTLQQHFSPPTLTLAERFNPSGTPPFCT